MKIRIKENSVRFRLTPTEVKRFCTEGSIEESTRFSSTTFNYGVKQKNIENLQVDFNGNTITLYVPESFAKEWYENDVVGIDHRESLDDGGTFFLLLEKDFACLDNTHEDQTDKYPNPKAGQC
ncbi:hypothetical protein R3X28_00245 [Maribacter sp. TH_r10]|uniref:Uncharacterized protein n=1 Tax=Maribacter luteus TaxID=2594478 RepID=A0A6I2MIS6_9FLAO|nr:MULTISPECIES: hypothetical protein [Maribacter]MDV7137279.1 hypothetical protein [Maribacter sp. TH_r10]MRX63608.1 hypothetical protein [Maribacter luteus]